ncbi:unnamed protein product [Aureobasidium vineae]|uniref:Uncharacterized protein n=1 Tax=Aureobasidium vineae TaxID=2773715 RepID=A0A9N8JQA5_9PEZI|nr:unnamed protein product [Aureobasidium vineae]
MASTDSSKRQRIDPPAQYHNIGYTHGASQIESQGLSHSAPMPHAGRTLKPAHVYEFDANVEQVDYIINEKWDKLSDARQYNKAWDATELVNKEIHKIAQSITEQSHHETKINALLSLCEIGAIVAIGGDRLGAEVRKHVGYDDVLVNVMLDITDLTTVNEKRAVTTDDMQALEEFDKERKGYCVFDNFEEVLDNIKKAMMDPSVATYDQYDDDDEYGDID